MSLLFLTPALDPKPHDISLLQTTCHLLTHQTSWLNPATSWLRPRGYLPRGQQDGPSVPFQTAWLLPWAARSYFKCGPGASSMTSYPAPPTMCYFCQFPCIIHLLLAAIFSQGKSFVTHKHLWWATSPGCIKVTECSESHVDLSPGAAAQLPISYRLAIVITHFPHSPAIGCGDYFGGPPLWSIVLTKYINY